MAARIARLRERGTVFAARRGVCRPEPPLLESPDGTPLLLLPETSADLHYAVIAGRCCRRSPAHPTVAQPPALLHN